jgi:predicted pyridoxine 5'-phosphate oxidase superfamily flavin-nucleotide-binding protein
LPQVTEHHARRECVVVKYRMQPCARHARSVRASGPRAKRAIASRATSAAPASRPASHRGGPAGLVRHDGPALWWPDYPGNDLFNSLGNLAVDPQAALLFVDFDAGRRLQLSGTAEVAWAEPGRNGADGVTGRSVRFTLERRAERSLPRRGHG